MSTKHTELEIFSFFERTPDWVCVAGEDGYFKNVNQAVMDTLKYSREEIMSRPISDFIHPDDKEITARKRTELLSGEALINFDNRYVSRDGETVWLHWTSIYFPEKEVVFAIAKDVTGRKKSEKEFEEKYRHFEHLTKHFKTTLEQDKRSLATELHEDLAQLVSVVKMDIGWLREELDDLSEPAKERLDHALTILDLLVNSIRRMSYAISPTMLDDVGLNDTLQWLCNEFTRQYNVPCFFESNVDDTLLSHEIQLDLFRICQEALNNVTHHADANSVTVLLENRDGKVHLTITDDGKGFDVENTSTNIGMKSMAGRAASVNGQIAVNSRPGEGTSISVSVV